MSNNISLTIRLPHELNVQLQEAAKQLGMTRTNLIRICIHFFLSDKNYTPIYTTPSGHRDRLVLNVNQLTFDILQNICNESKQSMNTVVTSIAFQALEYANKLL